MRNITAEHFCSTEKKKNSLKVILPSLLSSKIIQTSIKKSNIYLVKLFKILIIGILFLTHQQIVFYFVLRINISQRRQKKVIFCRFCRLHLHYLSEVRGQYDLFVASQVNLFKTFVASQVNLVLRMFGIFTEKQMKILIK